MSKLKFITILCLLLCSFQLNLYALTTLTSDDATIVISDDNTALIGYSVAELGKITTDLGSFYAISAPFDGSNSKFDSGKLYLYEESALSANIILTSNATITLQGSAKDEETGLFIISGGDLDKDGLNDFVLLNPNLATNQIKIYLGKYYNNWTTTTIINLTDPNIGIEQTSNRYLASNPASISGDLNGDGYDDLVIGITRNTDGSNSSGKIAIIYGSRDIESIDNTLLTAANHIITGQNENEGFGYSVSILKDINQDGYDELLVSAFNESTETGTIASLKYGKFTSIFPVSGNETTTYTYSSMDALFFSESNGTDAFGQYVNSIGDYNNDGFGDFAISAPKSGVNNGKIYLYNGSSTKFSGSYVETTAHSASLSLSNSYFLGLQGIQGKYDLTGDGIQNLVISQPLANSDSGSVYVLDSSKTYSGDIDFSSSIDFQINNTEDSGKFGHAISTGGDLNHDGISDLLIGSNGFDSNNGRAFLYQLSTTSTSNATAINLYSDENYSTEVTTAEINDRIYIEVTGNDPDAGEINTIEITVQSGTSSKDLILLGIETAINSGTYRTNFLIVGTRTTEIVNQIQCSKSDTVSVFPSFFSGTTDTFNVSNSSPSVSNISIEQIGSTENTQIYVSYDLIDLNNDSVSFADSASVQFSSDDGASWQNATVDATSSIVDAKNQLQSFNSNDSPLVLTNFSNYNGALKVRIRGNDGTDFSAYSESSSITVDNQAPSAATIFTINPKYTYNVIITGNAEALSTILVYQEDEYVQSVQTSSAGEFEITNLAVSNDSNSIYVYVQDSFNFISPSSNSLELTFSDRIISTSENSLIVTANIPLTATTNEHLLNLDTLTQGTLPISVPTIYNYVESFSFLSTGLEYHSFDKHVTFNVNFSAELASKNGLAVMLYNPNSNSWELNKSTIIDNSTTSLTFTSTYLGRYLIAQLNDINLPVISDVSINGSTILDNQYYGSTFTLSATLSDLDSTISSYNISIISDTTSSEVSSFSNVYTQAEAQNEVSISVTPTNLSSDTYTMTISTEDSYTNLKTSTFYFKVNTTQLNFSILAGPNPVNLNTSPLIFGYNISQDVDLLSIYILDQRGNTIFNHDIENVTAGYSTYSYNGESKNSQILNNGIYYAYCFVKKGETVIKKRLKIAVLK